LYRLPFPPILLPPILLPPILLPPFINIETKKDFYDHGLYRQQ
jgi:hypothetical protein